MTIQSLSGRVHIPTPIFAAVNFAPTNMALDAASEKAAFIIKVPKSGNISKVHYRVVLYSSTGALDIRLETVDTATGMPTGTLWGANTNVTDSPSATGWRICTLTSAAAVSKDDLVALVIAQPAVSPGNINVGYLAANATGFPYTALFTGSWAKSGAGMGGSGAIEYDDGSFKETIGLVSYKSNTAVAISSGSSPNYRGLRFSLPMPTRLRGCWIYCNAPASTTITVKLYSSDGATVLRTATLDTDQSQATGIAVRFIEWTSDVDILANTYYRLVIQPGATSINLYEFVFETAALLDTWGFGQNGHLTTATDPTVEASWTQTLTTSPVIGLTFSGFDDGAGIAGGLLVHPGMSGGMRG